MCLCCETKSTMPNSTRGVLSAESDIRSAIATVEARLVNLQVLELQARNTLNYVIEQIKEAETQRAELEERLLPINRLPAELLVEIFKRVVEFRDIHDLKELESWTFFLRPILLSHICRRWREVALSTSGLWACIPFTNKSTVSFFLEHSNNSPLDIVNDNPKFPVEDLAGRSTLCLQVALIGVDVFRRQGEISHRDAKSAHIGSLPSDSSTQFPVLEALRLANVSPEIIPPHPIPSLRTLELHFPQKTSVRPDLLKMSKLCAFLSRSPNLEELIFNDAIPVFDVLLRPSTANNDIEDTVILRRDTKLFIRPVLLRELRRLEWDRVPSNFWRFFCFVDVPLLERLEICLERHRTRRWWQSYDGVFAAIDSSPPIEGLPSDAVISFPRLKALSIECLGTDELASAFKRLLFPALRILAIAYTSPSQGELSHPFLPRQESIFREPRLPMLTHLTLSSFELDPENTIIMLKYMQSLEHLTLESCPGAGKVVCLLSGSTCGKPSANSIRSWVCPKLAHIVLCDCSDVQFKCLSKTIRARKVASSQASQHGGFSGTASPANGGPPRELKPLKRRVQQQLVGGTAFTAASCGSPSPTLTPSNGSFIPGWNLHKALMPSPISSVHVEGCSWISQAEATSLRERKWDVTEVVWIP
ncbi:hypothetical protein A0H81_00053 [Grifola frondosa]|uniref:Uncharacterized protein n=1 Tax=Grifola frondosa TaxID=5627 RepID=A0A1C7MRP2_GRIFR|nr:hypothetical protein A0H81_00053 [Grifola frondosa]